MSRTPAHEYGILLAHASETTIPGLVLGGFHTFREVLDRAGEIKSVQPWNEYELVRRVTPDAGWTSFPGLSLDELRIKRGWVD